jgi:hypothetical protein
MSDEVQSESGEAMMVRARRIVVSDDLPVPSPEVRGRRLESPPTEAAAGPVKSGSHKSRLLRRPKLLVAVGMVMLLIAAIAAVFAVQQLKPRTVQQEQPIASTNNDAAAPAPRPAESNDLRRVEDQANQVIRVLSRDNRPYSFSEGALREIEARTQELSRAPRLPESLSELRNSGELIASSAAKQGLQPSLVMLLGLALTRGGESGNCVRTATRALPLLASLSKTFGSNEGDSCLILIAAFREGPGTRRSHPLLRRMNRVVTNPLTQRNVWYLNEQHVLAADAYALVIDTIAYGVITRSPHQFGLDADPLNF